jgi:hypothetical protein
MRLSAAIVPPRAVLGDLERALRAVNVAPEPPAPRRLFGRGTPRRGAHAAGRPPTLAAPSDELSLVAAAGMYLPLAGFGNVTLADSRLLVDALRTEAATLDRPSVCLAGGTAMEFPGDDAVWAKLDGDVETVLTISRAVPMVVQRLGFFVDRRQFRPWLAVGTITGTTTAPHLEKVVACLEGYRSESWTVGHISVLRRPNEADAEDQFEEIERLPLRRA